MQPESLTIELAGSSDNGRCSCCGNHSRTIWGYIHSDGQPRAAYYVQWTLGRVHDHGANFDIVLGKWGNGTSPADRQVVSVAYRLSDGGPGFMIVDAAGRPAAKDDTLATTALRRDQVIGTPLAGDVFAMIDAIWLGDNRIRELTSKPEE